MRRATRVLRRKNPRASRIPRCAGDGAQPHMNTRRTRIRHRARRRGPSRLVILLFSGILALGLVAAIGVVGWVVAIAMTGPEIRELPRRDQGRSSQVFAADGTRLGFIQSRIVRQPVRSTEIPDLVRDATIAVEDQRFYDHKGVDFEGVVRAGVRNLTSGKTVEGGSTLTMQLVRTLYASNERNITRKIREAKLAEELENLHPGPEGKRWILNEYLNNVPYGTAGGQEIIGVQAAARAFFGKPARDLTLSQSALLAGLPQAPTSYNPISNAGAAKRRRNDVLRRMADQGMISEEDARKAQDEPTGVKPSGFFSQRTEGHVFDYVKKQLNETYGSKVVEQGGLKVYTSIDLKLQRAARKAMAASLGAPGMPASAIVSIDPKTGYILAMANSKSYGERKFNLAAQIKRQPGSTFKIMALMAAVRRGMDPDSTTYVSKPINIPNSPYGPVKVKTYDGSYGGSMTLTRATLKSDNAVYIQLALDVGPDLVKKAAVDMGIKSKLIAVPAESLGGLTNGVTPLEMANSYATIASGGYRNKPSMIKKVVFPAARGAKQKTDTRLGRLKRAKTFDNGVTGEVTKILQANVSGGTGTRAQTQCPTAGKTGTTDEFRDAWFAGYTPKVATAVWVGYEPNALLMRTQFNGGSVAGGTFPAIIWGAYMKQALAGKDCGTFPAITEPVRASRFRGRYASSGGAGTGDEAPSSTPGAPVVDEAVPEETKRPESGGDNGGGSNPGGGGGGNNGGDGGNNGGGAEPAAPGPDSGGVTPGT